MKTIYDFTMKNIDGEEVALSEYKGTVLLVVNVARKCGFTKQYVGLEKLYEPCSSNGLIVLGFPANNFSGRSRARIPKWKTSAV